MALILDGIRYTLEQLQRLVQTKRADERLLEFKWLDSEQGLVSTDWLAKIGHGDPRSKRPIFVRHYGTWVHIGDMTVAEAIAKERSWYRYQLREYRLSRC